MMIINAVYQNMDSYAGSMMTLQWSSKNFDKFICNSIPESRRFWSNPTFLSSFLPLCLVFSVLFTCLWFNLPFVYQHSRLKYVQCPFLQLMCSLDRYCTHPFHFECWGCCLWYVSFAISVMQSHSLIVQHSGELSWFPWCLWVHSPMLLLWHLSSNMFYGLLGMQPQLIQHSYSYWNLQDSEWTMNYNGAKDKVGELHLPSVVISYQCRRM